MSKPVSARRRLEQRSSGWVSPRKLLPRIGAVERLSLGLVALVLCLLMFADLLFGIVPDPAAATRAARQRLGETVAVQIAALLEAGDERTLGNTLQHVVGRNREVLSMAVRRIDGTLLLQRGNHAQNWAAPDSGRSSADHLRVPLQAGNRHWGDAEIAFAPSGPRGPLEWLRQPSILLFGVVGIGSFVLFYAYLRRAMQYLDPSTAVPDRVRKAFDVLADGVMVLDAKGRIVLVNQALRRLHPSAAADMSGSEPSQLEWLQPSLAEQAGGPWDRALKEAAPVAGEALAIVQPDGSTVETIVGCAPILDGQSRQRGCIVTFHDVSALHQANLRLRQAMTELEQSREQIKAQNEDLRRLATRDPLTGCFNRRALFDIAGDLLVAALRRNGELCCVMGDIDHFKQFNDVHGHAVGDQVIQVVARTLTSHLRQGDVLCRYGGEEFCIVLPNTTFAQALDVAERMRVAIAETASQGVRSAQVRQITSSFGVASLTDGATQLEQLIEQADSALYASKAGGRNRVTAWAAPAA